MPALSTTQVRLCYGNCNSAAQIKAEAVAASSLHADYNSSHTCFVPDVLVSFRKYQLRQHLKQLTPKLTSPLLKLLLRQRRIIRESSLDSFAYGAVLVNYLNLRVLQVCYVEPARAPTLSNWLGIIRSLQRAYVAVEAGRSLLDGSLRRICCL